MERGSGAPRRLRARNVQEYSIAKNDGISAGYNSYMAPDLVASDSLLVPVRGY
ncbi:MAG: hypothetical protein FJ090_21000 [Deltaproteobacteria bacterium]|nr:hypothetical protein [Deltaproteobacteria bacterium]